MARKPAAAATFNASQAVLDNVSKCNTSIETRGLFRPPIENVLIVPAHDDIAAADCTQTSLARKGVITFSFLRPFVTLLEIGLLNVENDVAVTTVGGVLDGSLLSAEFKLDALGNNSLGSIRIDRENIEKAHVILNGPAGITYIAYCVVEQ